MGSYARASILSYVWLLIVNAVVLVLLYEVLQDYAFRTSYWESMGFTPHTSRTLFFFITSATNGTTYIPGTLTLDWSQILVVLLLVIDLSYLIGWLRRRSAARSMVPHESSATHRSVARQSPRM